MTDDLLTVQGDGATVDSDNEVKVFFKEAARRQVRQREKARHCKTRTEETNDTDSDKETIPTDAAKLSGMGQQGAVSRRWNYQVQKPGSEIPSCSQGATSRTPRLMIQTSEYCRGRGYSTYSSILGGLRA